MPEPKFKVGDSVICMPLTGCRFSGEILACDAVGGGFLYSVRADFSANFKRRGKTYVFPENRIYASFGG